MVSRTNFPIFLDQVFVMGALLKLLVPFDEQKIRLEFKPISMLVQRNSTGQLQVVDRDCRTDQQGEG
jgi:hypothetical protein